jgi:uncharacterized protein YmfQ (DUF2313 family)
MGALTDKYRRQLQALLPSGLAWPQDPDSTLAKVLAAMAEELARVDSRTLQLIEEADPRTAYELLPDWERVCGLPDTCTGTGAQTIAERRAAVAAKLTARGGASIAYFQALAEHLGYTVRIDVFRPFMCGRSRCGDALNGPATVRHYWRVTVTGPRFTPFRCGASQCGDSLGKISRAADLECLLNRLKPAHTQVIVAYQGA